MTAERRALGAQGLTVSVLGLGCLPMSDAYGGTNEATALRAVDRALELGIDFLDTSDAYGEDSGNERLVAKAIRGRRHRFVVATKFGVVRSGSRVAGVDGRPEYVRAAVDASLRRLETDHIDLYLQHRIDPTVPVEETVGALGELVAAGKVRYLGLSEASAATLRRAHAVHPLSAVQTEYSLWCRDVEERVLPTVRELGVGLVAYSPLGRGLLAGAVGGELPQGDYRRELPRFQGANLARNLELVDRLRTVAVSLRATSAQVALAWLLARGDDVVPIPGMERAEIVEENAAARELALEPTDLAALDGVFVDVAGARYDDDELARVEL